MDSKEDKRLTSLLREAVDKCNRARTYSSKSKIYREEVMPLDSKRDKLRNGTA